MKKILTYCFGALIIAGASTTALNAQTISFGSPMVAGHSMVPPDTSGIPIGAPLVAPKLPDTLSPDAQIGKRAFDAVCAACHGENAAGINGTAPPLIHFIYEPNHHPLVSFLSAVQKGVPAHHWHFGDMAPVEGVPPAIVKNIEAYIREVQRENGIPG
ncbi:cytochrome c [Phaeovulum sp.]|uniref:c-type cytochrome n=1 Tax=Phaeovulum sp. TaxID=2934796 RepID=UPI00356A84A8